ncbi:MAG: formylglycine-generating enzyme family protein [Calothrix sp. FI2-JRJ7]|jgi:formylglycine-generating enzyme required for sulfatase activity|nr:formylglycine-generating enzyme family protein [Calothrix sp. FI2-JRJ7]
MALTITKHRQTGLHFVEDLGNGVKLEMVLVKGGTFTMGAPETEESSHDNERPQHLVTVPTFFMGKYPITQAQWRAVANMQDLRVNRNLKPDPSEFKGDELPVEQVSWYDAVEFCLRLASYTNTKRRYRLPSEAEWEYACRAGTTTPFHFGKTITTELANYKGEYTYGNASKGEYRRKTTSVGSFGVANAFGLYDMHGNVWGWCLDDWHDNYEGAPTDGTAWFGNKNDNIYQKPGRAVLRGGSWDTYPGGCRSASRYFDDRAESDGLYDHVGFRVVCGVGRILQ